MGDVRLSGHIRDGDLKAVQTLLKEDREVNVLMGLQGTPLCAAISANQPEIITYLLKRPACDVNAKDFDGEPPICLAIRKRNMEALKLMIARKECDVNKRDPVSGDPPVTVAVTSQYPEAVELLVEAGCDVNLAGAGGFTPLHQAIVKKSLDSVNYILDTKRVDVNQANNNGESAIHLAAKCFDNRILESLLASCVIVHDEEQKQLEYNHLLLNKQAGITGNTALHIAVHEQNIDGEVLLIERSPLIDVKNNQDQTPLYLACEVNRFDITENLLRCGADPKIMSYQNKHEHCYVTKRSRAPIHLSTTYGNYHITTLLAEYGADFDAQDENGQTPLHYALNRNKLDIAIFLMGRKGKRRMCDVNITDIGGNTPLFCVSHCVSARQLTQKLLRRGCSINHRNSRGITALHAAMDMDCSEVVEVLLDNGAPVDEPSSDGHTLLHICALEDCSDMARVLLFFGADMYARTNDGHMALRLALENNSYDVMQVLLQCGYNVSREGFKEDQQDLPFALVEDEALRNHVMQLSQTPVRLGMQCRRAIRDHFKANSRRMRAIRRLPLPKKINDFLLFKTN